ncbi:ATPase family protein associated with various cellular activities (AAA) [Anaerobacterium chartisolvens]|uniref:ATPase family protein associated with various cellular activities (AAA) n=1 Tax=Anaerobacterium chartisolvens TaxID=1297424 RepID=A0A369AMM9_9FIRM|nr:ATP-binding protein [Anaerobacterium chartisolvens]RCX10431.1 ATPase family protein associated with various cellular activities (AAA) [Anaerobacterium chartisolvens]
MNHFSEVIKIIDGALKADKKKVVDYSTLLAGKLENDGELVKCQRISKMLERYNYMLNENISVNSITAGNIKQLPFDQESKLELADILLPNQIDERNLVLSEETEKQIKEITLAYLNKDKLASYALDMPMTMILFGPPGCGKTEIALSVARKLNLPIIIARLDTLVSSYLGNTAKNIRFLFDYASKIPCVLFLDEFDAIAKQRDDMHEMGELKRVVNSLLQNIDSLNSKSILIAATNHEQMLDEAIWRRFNIRVNVVLPNHTLIYKYLEQISNEIGHLLDAKSMDFLSCLFQGQSVADIQQIVKRSFRRAVLENRSAELADFVEHFFAYVYINQAVPDDADLSRRKKVEYLLKHNSGLSNRFLGEVLRCHHNTIKNDREKIKSEVDIHD